jgi:hypothetical protein
VTLLVANKKKESGELYAMGFLEKKRSFLEKENYLSKKGHFWRKKWSILEKDI